MKTAERILLTEEVLIEPGEEKSVMVVDKLVPVPGTGIPGYPETQCFHKTPIEKLPFQLRYVETTPEIAPHFNVVNVFFGATGQLTINRDGVSCQILNKRPAISTLGRCQPFLSICLLVRNTSKEPRKFKAKLVGDDVEPMAKPVLHRAAAALPRRG